MRKIWNKGHRIRASDKHLVYHFSIGTLLFIFAAVLLLLNIKQIMRTDWEHFSLLENGLTLSPYNFITILIATGVCALVTFLYYRFCYDSFKKLLHRQKLARMILENKWYEADTIQDSVFFTDLQSRYGWRSIVRIAFYTHDFCVHLAKLGANLRILNGNDERLLASIISSVLCPYFSLCCAPCSYSVQ